MSSQRHISLSTEMQIVKKILKHKLLADDRTQLTATYNFQPI